MSNENTRQINSRDQAERETREQYEKLKIEIDKVGLELSALRAKKAEVEADKQKLTLSSNFRDSMRRLIKSDQNIMSDIEITEKEAGLLEIKRKELYGILWGYDRDVIVKTHNERQQAIRELGKQFNIHSQKRNELLNEIKTLAEIRLDPVFQEYVKNGVKTSHTDFDTPAVNLYTLPEPAGSIQIVDSVLKKT